MIEMNRPVIDRSMMFQPNMSSMNRDIYYELISLKTAFYDENRNLGNQLKNDLDVEEDRRFDVLNHEDSRDIDD